MFTSDIDAHTPRRIRTCLLAALLLAAGGQIYQHFGHGMRAASMSLAFLIPLLGGSVHLALWRKITRRQRFTARVRLGQWLLLAGLAAMTLGALFHGIVSIAGVDGVWHMPLLVLGGTLFAVSVSVLWLTTEPSQEASPCKCGKDAGHIQTHDGVHKEDSHGLYRNL